MSFLHCAVSCAVILSLPLPVLSLPPATARIDCVVPAARQPDASDPHVIWHDDFDRDRIGTYLEPAAASPDAKVSSKEALGGRGGAMECFYPSGGHGRGNRKLVFGDSPIGKPLRPGERFEDVYWRIYVKHQPGWVGHPDKMSRATGLASAKWNQAFISHVWSSGVVLTLDPASGTQGDHVVTSRYNDFAQLHWLGNSPKGKFPVHSAAEAGRWICIESRVKLNSPGKKDGYAALWVDGRLDAERRNLDFRGNYQGVGSAVNAIFLEAYWNEGSPKDQYRWYDDFVVSTQPIGPIYADREPVLIRTGVECAQWQVQVGAGPNGDPLTWTSRELSGTTKQATVTDAHGTFAASATGQVRMEAGPTYYCRIRSMDAQKAWSDWSAWHQPFRVCGVTGAATP